MNQKDVIFYLYIREMRKKKQFALLAKITHQMIFYDIISIIYPHP